jgi:hypothetical protein
MDSPAELRQEISRSLAPVRRLLVVRQGVRLLANAAAWGALGVLVGLLFFQLLPWLVSGRVPGFAALGCTMSGLLAAIWGVVRDARGWSWPTQEDCALALKLHSADGCLPTAVGLRNESAFAPPILRAAREAVSGAHELTLGAAISTPKLIAAPVLLLVAAVAWVACAALPVDLVAETTQAPVQPSVVSSRSAPSASDIAAFEQAMGERRQQDALGKAASDLRDEGKSEQQRQQSLDEARAQATKSGKPLPSEIPQAVPTSKGAREALAEILEAAASAAGARAEEIEKSSNGAAATDNGGEVTPNGTVASKMQTAPAYEARRFENSSEALSDQPPQRRELAQAAVDSLAKIKQGK